MLDPMMFQFTKVMRGLFVDDAGFADINTVPAVWSVSLFFSLHQFNKKKTRKTHYSDYRWL